MRRGLVVLDHRDGDEFRQISRVLRVLAKVEGVTLRKITSAHDHKGTLYVNWAEEPQVDDMIRVENGWGEENEYVLFYELPNGRQLSVETGTTRRTPV